MQRIELNEQLVFPRCILDLTAYLAEEPTTAQLLMHFEESLDQGYNTFLLPTNPMALASIDDVLLQRPYLKNQLHFLCVITPQQNEQQWQTNYQALMETVEGLQQQLDIQLITIGLIDGRDALFDPVATAQAIEDLRQKQCVASFGVREMTSEQLAILQLYCEDGVNFWYQKFSHQLLNHFRAQAPFFRHQMFPMLHLPNSLENAVRGNLDIIAAEYGVSVQAIVLAWLLFHPLTIMPVFDSYFGKTWQQAYREQQQFELTVDDWYEINQRLS